MSGADVADNQTESIYAGEPVTAKTSRIISWGLGALFVGFVVYMILAATVLKGDEAPGVSFGELKDQPIYIHQPPAARDTRMEQGQSGVPGDSAHRWVVRGYVTKLTSEQTRDWYLRQFGTTYSLQDTTANDNAAQRVLLGALPLSERTTANPPTLNVKIAIGREMAEERTQVTLSIESDF